MFQPIPARTAPIWSVAWMAVPQQPRRFSGSGWDGTGFAHHTLRQVVRVGSGGGAVRVRLSNRYGTAPLPVQVAAIARTVPGAGIRPATLRPLTCGSSVSFTIPAGVDLVTDSVPLRISPFESLTISMYLAGSAGAATQHTRAFATTFRAVGDHHADAVGTAFTETSQSWYYLSGIEVANVRPQPAAVVVFGDSIVDGFGSTANSDHRFPDELARRLVAAGIPHAVLNAGISGNRLVVDSAWLGESGARRFRRDALELPGVGTVIVLEGTNDIGLDGASPDVGEPPVRVTADQLIAAHRELIRQARARGVRVLGATLPPFEGCPFYSDKAEAERRTVNHWLRTSGEYDAVIDFDAALADPGNPRRLAPAFDSGDHLHPNDLGYTAMADAVNLADLNRGTRDRYGAYSPRTSWPAADSAR
ncbi:SGNH/GDSL hydrolase family protein [Nocardia sp. ET3-3]|uniref:SGNH/GDSL hydrolase family protein n=1 Tax=Nocardia terrae TaxID=2675851 RepID=A0A7K1UVE4_9NOCA|nr:SGNH/GDSL hydrolase family protein [Nocardia terrae]MVU78334.1 SGNH/GDSL hydrolase family protein [Nocardia terrae]